MKFVKVMFSQVSVCPQERGCLPHCMLGHTPPRPEADTPRQTPPWADTPQVDTSLGRHSPQAVHAGIG